MVLKYTPTDYGSNTNLVNKSAGTFNIRLLKQVQFVLTVATLRLIEKKLLYCRIPTGRIVGAWFMKNGNELINLPRNIHWSYICKLIDVLFLLD